MNALEAAAEREWRAWGSAWAFFGLCRGCGRTHGDDGKPLLVRGPRRASVLCLDCYDRKGA